MFEKTIFDIPASASVPGSPSSANPDMTRYVVAPINLIVACMFAMVTYRHRIS